MRGVHSALDLRKLNIGLLVGATANHLVLFVTPVQVLNVARVLQVRTDLANAAWVLRQVFTTVSVVVASIYAPSNIVALIPGGVADPILLTCSSWRVYLRDPIQVRLRQIVLRIVVLLVTPLDQLLFCFLEAKRANEAISLATYIDVGHVTGVLFGFL